MSHSLTEIIQKVARLKEKAAARDGRMYDVRAVRAGHLEQLAPGLFPDDWPKAIVANFVDTAARQLAEVIAPLPTVSTSGASQKTEVARRFQDKRGRIANYYMEHSEIERQMVPSADRYISYGLAVAYVEPDLKAGCPRIVLEDPFGSYVERDRWGRVTTYVKRWSTTVGDLCAMFPEHDTKIRGYGDAMRAGNAQTEIVRYVDGTDVVMFMPQVGGVPNAELARYKHGMSRCPAAVEQRPGLDDEQRGQYDDVLWIQVARARMALLALEAAEKSVQAPIVATPDMQEIAFGSDAILYSQNPEKVRRLPVEIPQSAFAEMASLGSEMQLGARYNKAHAGELDNSVVTGRGVQELSAGFDTQVKTAHAAYRRLLTHALSLCFEMDEKLWPKREKTITGIENDAPYEVTYIPSKDIKGDHSVDVTYGMAAGLDPNRAVVLLLQLRGDRAISRDFMLRQMPFPLNVTDELARIDIEEMRDAIKQGLNGLGAGIPELIAAGQDPVDLLMKFAKIVQAREKGVMIEDAFVKAFTPPPAPEGATSPPVPGAAPLGPGGPAGAGGPGSPVPTGVVPGQEGMGAGGAPDLQMLLAGLTGGGEPNLQAAVSRRMPA